MNMIAMRFAPNQDLKQGLEAFIAANNITSGFVATCVGSLHKVTLRMAGAKPEMQDIRSFDGHFEIVSLVGTLSQEGAHLHLAVSDENGHVIGGHLKEGSIVTTTVEIVIGYDENVKFKRTLDPATGFDELTVE